MTNNLLRALIFVFFLALIAAPTQAQEFGRLGGTVMGEDGKPLSGVVVKIQRTDQEANYEVKTNGKGVFLHSKLPVGTYNVSLSYKDEVLASAKNMQITTQERPPFNFDLKAYRERMASLVGPTDAVIKKEDLVGLSNDERKAYEEAVQNRQQELAKIDSLNTLFNDGMAAVQAQDYATAVTTLKEAAKLTDTQHVVWGNLGSAQSKLAETKTGEERAALMADAIASYTRAMEIDSKQAAYPHYLAMAQLEAGQRDEGIAMLDKAVALDSVNGSRYYFNAGALLTNKSDIDGAIIAFRKATIADPKYANAHFQLGMALSSKATFSPTGAMQPAEGTMEAFQRYLELEPTGADAETAKAMVQTLSSTVDTSLKK